MGSDTTPAAPAAAQTTEPAPTPAVAVATPPVPAAPEPPTTPRAADCAAMIYSPGLFEKEDGKSLTHFAERVARALDQQDAVVGLKFATLPARLEAYGEESRKREVEVREIVRVAGDGRREITHRIYFLDYETELVAAKTEHNWFTETWALGSTLWTMGVRYATHGLRARSLSPNQKAAVAVAGAGLVLLTGAFVFALVQALAMIKVDVPAPEFSWAWFWTGLAEASRVLEPITLPLGGEYVSRLVVWSAGLVAIFAHGLAGCVNAVWVWLDAMKAWLLAGGIGLLSIKRVRAELERGLNLFLMSARYFIAGRGRVKCTGRFNDLLEHVAETNAGRVDVVGYSMGSLVALDALFPWIGTPAKRCALVRTLTTIGCPFDFVRAFWPAYFEGRAAGATGLRWVNVYSPLDLLGSNFVNAPGPAPVAMRGINACSPDTSDKPAAAVPGEAGAAGEQAAAPDALAAPPAQDALVANDAARPDVNLFYDHLGRRELRWTEALGGEAFSAHSQYWVRGDPEAESCLSAVVAVVYGPQATGTRPAT